MKATDIQVRSSRKRQKTQIKSEEEPQDIPDYEQIKDPREDQVFRFMDLPGGKYNVSSTVCDFANKTQNFATVSTVMQQIMHIVAFR